MEEESAQTTESSTAVSSRTALKEDMMTPKVLAYLVTIGFFGILAFMLFFPVPPGAGHEVLLIMIGSLGTSWSMIIGFYFGSSAGSQRQNRAMLAQTGPRVEVKT